MWSHFLLFSLFIETTLSQNPTPITCPFGYSDGKDGSCYRAAQQYATRNYAYNDCAKDGAYIVDINNAFQNTQLLNWAQTKSTQTAQQTAHIGLTCIANANPTSCIWDGTGKAITNSSYTNFKQGDPYIYMGPCVYMDSDGFWTSGDCASRQSHYICKFTPGITVPNCPPPKQPSYHNMTSTFRGKCYWILPDVYEHDDGERACSQNCGTITSVHSYAENEFVRNFIITPFISSITIDNFWIGLVYSNTTGNYSWSDGTAYDFNAFNQKDHPMWGSCVATSCYDMNWYTYPCTCTTMPVVCERDWNTNCY